MTTFVSNRNSDGKTDENGHFRLPLKMIEGEVFEGFSVTAGQGMTIQISKGEAKVPYQDYAYAVWSDTSSSLQLTPASPNYSRIDRVVAYVDRGMSFASSQINNPNSLKFIVVTGTPSNSPVRPTNSTVQSSVGAGNPFIDLADITVAQGMLSVTNAVIDNSVKKEIKISPKVGLPGVKSTTGDDLKFVIINEGEPLPPADPKATLVVLIARN